MNRIRLLLFSMFVVAVTALTSGISLTYAEHGPAVVKDPAPVKKAAVKDPAAAKKAAEKDPAIAKKKADAAVRARAKRDEAIQRKKATREYIKKVGERQQSGAGATAPDNTGKEGAK